MEYDYSAAARHLETMRSKVRSMRIADGSYKDVGLPEIVNEVQPAEPEKVSSLKLKKGRVLDS